MRQMVLRSAFALVLASGVSDASAMGGSGDLSPSESPYAILEPQTVAPVAAPIIASEPPTSVLHPVSVRRPHIAHRAKKTP